MSDTTIGEPEKPQGGPDTSVEGLLLQQVQDWMRGERFPLRVYLDRQPVIRERPDAIVELINQEIVLRQMRGETPLPEDYLGDFPDLSESLQRLFEVHAAASSLPSALRDGWDMDETPIEPAAGRRRVVRAPNIPGYDIEGVLGRGGIGVVYLARHRALHRKVALKLLHEAQQDDPGHRARFQREAAAVARCQHPHLVQIHEIGEYDDQFYLALEYVEGGTLARTLAGVPQTPRYAASLLETLARAMDHAHAQGVVHRDLKPANVLMTSDGQPKITDFGLAKLNDSSYRTEEKTLVGTFAYMSPEQVRGESEAIGPGVDIHSLGCILYEALTGRPPYRAATPQQILHAILSEQVTAPSARVPGIPRDLEAICLKCLEKEAKDRYATAADLAEDLRRFLDGRDTLARPASRLERGIRWCRRNPWIAASIVILLVGTSISTWQAIRATAAESAAKSAEGAALIERNRAEAEARAAKKERERAESEAETALAVNEFLRDFLSQATPSNQARIDRRADPNLKLRVALDYAAETIGERFRNRPLVEAATRLTIGEDYMELGLYAQARPHLERAFELRRKLLGEKDPLTLIAKCRLGMLFLVVEKPEVAEPLLVSAMEGLMNTKGSTDVETLEAMRAVGGLYANQGKHAESQEMFTRVLNEFRAVLGPDHYRSLNAASELALTLGSRGDGKEAVKLLEEAIALTSKKVGPDHPATLTATYNLAFVQEAIGQKAESVKLLEKVWRMQQTVMGKGHPDTLTTRAMLGFFYTKHQENDKAEPILLETLSECRKSLDRNHLAIDLMLGSLATIYASRNEVKKAFPYLLEAYDITRSLYGPDEELTAVAASNLALAHQSLKEIDKAESLFQENLEFWLRHGPEDLKRYNAEGAVGSLMIARKAYLEGEQKMLLAHEWMFSHRGEIQPQIIKGLQKTEERVVEAYEKAGNRDRAIAWKV